MIFIMFYCKKLKRWNMIWDLCVKAPRGTHEATHLREFPFLKRMNEERIYYMLSYMENKFCCVYWMIMLSVFWCKYINLTLQKWYETLIKMHTTRLIRKDEWELRIHLDYWKIGGLLWWTWMRWSNMHLFYLLLVVCLHNFCCNKNDI